MSPQRSLSRVLHCDKTLRTSENTQEISLVFSNAPFVLSLCNTRLSLLYLLKKLLHMLENKLFYLFLWCNFKNFQCIDGIISIRLSLNLQTKERLSIKPQNRSIFQALGRATSGSAPDERVSARSSPGHFFRSFPIYRSYPIYSLEQLDVCGKCLILTRCTQN